MHPPSLNEIGAKTPEILKAEVAIRDFPGAARTTLFRQNVISRAQQGKG
jgi:hypothetical protein